jgi:aspartate/methionine/tyrosine aminotransferase
MAGTNAQALELNEIIAGLSPTTMALLSRKGKAIYYPRRGILAQGAAAKDKAINATIGTAYGDDGKPMVLPSLAKRLNVDPSLAFPYAPSEGSKPLREKWQELIRQKNPSLGQQAISLPIVSCGVTHGLSLAGYLFLDEGDEIILPDLYWENYDLVFGNACGAEFTFFRLFQGDDFDIDSFTAALLNRLPKKKVVLLNFPNNPSGYAPTVEVAGKIVAALKKSAEQGNRIAVILDDSYFGLFFEAGLCQESLFSWLAGLHENILAIKLDGITKEEYAWGLRVGFISYATKNGTRKLYQALEDKTAGAVRGSISNACHPSQSLFLEALKSAGYRDEKAHNKRSIEIRFNRVRQTLADHPEYKRYFESLPFNSGYFMCLKLFDVSAPKVWQRLLDHYSTGVISYDEGNLFRVAFASTPLAKIELLFDHIYRACQDCAGDHTS